MLVALQEAGLWPQFEDWKRGVVRVLGEEARESGTPPFPVWDFSGFNSVTNEHVPAAGDTTTEVRWWWEPSHYKREAGDLVLDRVLDHAEPGRALPADFGVKLDPATIESSLAAIRSAGLVYPRQEADEYGIIKAIVDEAMSGAEGANCGSYREPLRVSVEAAGRGDLTTAHAALVRAKAIYDADRRRFEEMGVLYREPVILSGLHRGEATCPRPRIDACR